MQDKGAYRMWSGNLFYPEINSLLKFWEHGLVLIINYLLLLKISIFIIRTAKFPIDRCFKKCNIILRILEGSTFLFP